MGRPEGRRGLSPDSAAPIVLTGATGWFGRASLERLSERLGPELGRRAALFASSAKRLELRDGTALAVEPLAGLPRTPGEGGLLAHFAFLTRDRVADLGHDRYVAVNEAITEAVAGWVRSARPAYVLLASSGAVHCAGELGADPYGRLKLLEEQALASACAAVGARLCVIRAFNVSGPYMRAPERYALGSMIGQALAARPIEVKAAHPVIRSFVAITELLELGLAVLADDAAGDVVTFDSAGEEEVEVGELAARVAHVLGRPPGDVTRPAPVSSPVDRYVGDPGPIARLRERHSIEHVPLDEQIRRTASVWGAPAASGA